MSLPYPRYTRPVLFYALATLIPWALWFLAAWLSHREQMGPAALLALAGLIAPLGVVWWIARDDAELRRDMLRRIWDFRGVRPTWIILAVGLTPAAVLLATLISLPLGYSPEQFLLRGATTFAVGVIPGWVALILAPVLEELAWHSYGTDSLRNHFSLFTTSVIFGVVWAIWHLPLAFFAGSAQEEMVEQGVLHALNFPLSMLPFVVLINWIYYRGNRNVTLTVLFHLAANLSTQVIRTHPDTELIATGVLLVVTVVVLWVERDLFFTPVRRRSRLRAAA